MLKKIVLIAFAVFIFPLNTAEEKRDSENQGIINHSSETFSDPEDLTKTAYPVNHPAITSTVVELFREARIHPTNLRTVGMVIRGEYTFEGNDNNSSVLFLDPRGRSSILTYEEGTFPINCIVNSYSSLCKVLPKVTVLYNNGELVHFKRKRRCCTNQWVPKKIATLGKPFAIKILAPFDNGTCMYCSEKELTVLDTNGEQLWTYPNPEEENNIRITDVVSAFHQNRFALCTSTSQLVQWRAATRWDKIKTCDRSITGLVEEEQLETNPLSLKFDLNGKLRINYSTPGRRNSQSNDDEKL